LSTVRHDWIFVALDVVFLAYVVIRLRATEQTI